MLRDGREGELAPQRNILRSRGGLDGYERDLRRQPRAEAREDLVPDPFACCGADAEGGDETCGDAADDGAAEEELHVGAEAGDEEAGGDLGEGEGDEVGKGVDAGAFGRGAQDGLEVEGEVVYVAFKRMLGGILGLWDAEGGRVTCRRS